MGGGGNVNKSFGSNINGGISNFIGGKGITNSVIYSTNSAYYRVTINGDVTTSYVNGDSVQFFNTTDNQVIRGVITNSTYSAPYTCLDLDTSTGSNIYGGKIYNLSFQLGGCNNFIGGGQENFVSGCNNVVNGGCRNINSSLAGFIGGGCGNSGITSSYITVVGGELNCSSGLGSFIGGGQCNRSCLSYSFIGGGQCNVISGQSTTIVGGFKNSACCSYAYLGGGYQNASNGCYSVLDGGINNISCSFASVVVGGNANSGHTSYSFVGGGICNAVTSGSDCSVIGGGVCNRISTNYLTIVTGKQIGRASCRERV